MHLFADCGFGQGKSGCISGHKCGLSCPGSCVSVFSSPLRKAHFKIFAFIMLHSGTPLRIVSKSIVVGARVMTIRGEVGFLKLSTIIHATVNVRPLNSPWTRFGTSKTRVSSYLAYKSRCQLPRQNSEWVPPWFI
jgi:hypothetical protein